MFDISNILHHHEKQTVRPLTLPFLLSMISTALAIIVHFSRIGELSYGLPIYILKR